jgi:hypothetical protein
LDHKLSFPSHTTVIQPDPGLSASFYQPPWSLVQSPPKARTN